MCTRNCVILCWNKRLLCILITFHVSHLDLIIYSKWRLWQTDMKTHLFILLIEFAPKLFVCKYLPFQTHTFTFWCAFTQQPRHCFAYQWLDNFKIKRYAILSKYTMRFKGWELFHWLRSAGLMLSKASSILKGCYICWWLDNVDMQTYAKYDMQNILCGSSYSHFY